MMLNHFGLHSGKRGLWDPRTDMMIFDLDEITQFESSLSFPNFVDWVTTHEILHRVFYESYALMDISSLNLAINIKFSGIGLDKLEKYDCTRSYKNNMPRIYEMLRNVDPLFDAFSALTIFDYQNKGILDLEETKYFNILASYLLTDDSRKIFDYLVWLYKKSSEFLNNANSLPSMVISFSLNSGLYPFLKSSKQLEASYPLEVFYAILKILRYLHKTRKDFLKEFLIRLHNAFQNHDRKELMILSYYFQEIVEKHSNKVIHWMYDDDKEKLRYSHHKSFTNLLKIKPMTNRRDLLPAFILTKDNEKIELRTTRKINSEHYGFLQFNLVMTHAQDCIFRKKNVECFLCKYKPELCHNDYHKMIKNIEENLIPA